MRRRAILSALAPALALALAAPPAAHAAEKAEKKKGGGASYIQIQALTATTNAAGGRRGVLTVETGVDIPDGGLRAFCEASLPRLRAAYVQVVQTYAAGLAPLTPPNADFLARELQRETDRVLGRRGARLLLGAILVS
ncbi:hypothetical protein [Phenylobacterium sp.]|uniref:hypothetical protein n=1 Tax=Phenylobacterium sp. TaxID=1871053 RepID=UPI002F3F4539